MTRRYNLFSLFSNAGGLDIGFSLSRNYNLLFANDVLQHPAETYTSNYEHKIIILGDCQLSKVKLPAYLVGDIAKVDFKEIKCLDIDVIVGGPPCQDFSKLRGTEEERKGVSVQRGKMYSHFIRAMIHLKPKVFVFENVPGLKNANRGEAYKAVLEDFSKLSVRWKEIKKIVGNGYKANSLNYKLIFSGSVNSADFGVPQNRRRIIIIGIREDLFGDDRLTTRSIIDYAYGALLGKNSPFKKYPLTPIEAFEGRVLPELDQIYKDVMKEYTGLEKDVKTARAREWAKEWGQMSFDAICDYKKLNSAAGTEEEFEEAIKAHKEILKKLGYLNRPVEAVEFSDGTQADSLETPSVRERMKHIPPNENHIFVKDSEWHVEGKNMSLIYRRLHPLKPSYTIVAKGGGGTFGYHYRRDRGKLTNRERARIQTFPDWFEFIGKITQMRLQIGEAVPPLLGKKIAEVATYILEEADD